MRSTTIGALRAHLVLLSAATGVVSAAAVVLVALLHLPEDHSGPEARASMFGAALLLTLYLWKRAWQAFRAALRTDQVALSTVTRNGVAITERCPDAWLVQLYVELSRRCRTARLHVNRLAPRAARREDFGTKPGSSFSKSSPSAARPGTPMNRTSLPFAQCSIIFMCSFRPIRSLLPR